MLLRNKSSKSSSLSDFPSKVGSGAVRAFGMGSVVGSVLSAPNSVLAAAGRSVLWALVDYGTLFLVFSGGLWSRLGLLSPCYDLRSCRYFGWS